MGIELDRMVDSIRVGHRHRADLGDIDTLAASIREQGLLQPVTVTPDGVLVCGRRRLAAIQQLGWRKVSVWVRSGISDRLGHLLAEQDENVHHKPLTQVEAAALYRELKQLMAEDAARREQATRFSSENQPGSDGGGKFPPPSQAPRGKAREHAAAMIPGAASYKTLEKITAIQRIADDPDQPGPLREQAAQELAEIGAGAPVDPAHQRIRAAIAATDEARQAELHALAEQAVARVTTERDTQRTKPAPGVPGRWPVAAFIQTWTSLTDWWTHYDVAEVAAELTDEQAAVFLTVAEGTAAFATELRHYFPDDLTDGETESTDADNKADQDEEPMVARGHLRAL